MIILKTITSVISIILILCIILLIKNENTLKVSIKVIDAIYKYNISHNDKISYDTIRSYDSTLFRIWDWRCKHVVDKETYSKIKECL